MGDITTEPQEIQDSIRVYYKQLHSFKLKNLEVMAIFLEKCLPIRNEEVKSLSRPITGKEIKTVIKKLSKNKVPDQMDEFYETVELLPLIHRLKISKR